MAEAEPILSPAIQVKAPEKTLGPLDLSIPGFLRRVN
jgi:hypothetical protein